MQTSQVDLRERCDCSGGLARRPVKPVCRHNRYFLASLLAGILGCATASYAQPTWQESGDAGDLVGIAQHPPRSGALTTIKGTVTNSLGISDLVDMYCIDIPNPSLFSATLSSGSTQDNPLFLFDHHAMGITSQEGFYSNVNGGPTPSRIGISVQPPTPGKYYLAIGTHDNYADTSPSSPPSSYIWYATVADAGLETAPNGPSGTPGPLTSWDLSGGGGGDGAYTITLAGVNYCECLPPPSGMVAWWPLDEIAGTTANDIAMINNKGMHLGAPGPVFISGMVAGALSFDGINDHVSVQHDSSLDPGTGPFSIDLWAQRAPGFSGTGGLVQKWAPAGAPNTPGMGYSFFFLGGVPTLLVEDGVCSSTPGASLPSIPGWVHYAVTVDVVPGGTYKVHFYANGVLASPPGGLLVGCSGGSLSNTIPLLIGRHTGPTIPSGPPVIAPLDFKGEIDEVEIFDRVLSQSEIQDIFNAGSAGKCKCADPPSDMVAWWPLDETSGPTAEDIVGTNDGTQQCLVTFGPGKVGGAYRLTRASQARGHVVVPNVLFGQPSDFEFGLGSFTIDAWIYPEQCSLVSNSSFCYPRPIVNNEASSSLPPGTIGFEFFVDGPYYAQLTAIPGGLGLRLPSQTILSNLTPVVDNQWQHVAVRVDRTTGPGQVTFFYNGAQLGISFVPPPWPVNSPPSMILGGNLNSVGNGCNPNSYDCGLAHYFNGWLDEIEIFKRALDDDEIAAIYGAGAHGKCKPASLMLNALRENQTPNDAATNPVVVIERMEGSIESCPCADPTDCDDGLFCNGEGTCDAESETCVAGTNPCPPDQVCDEDQDACVSIPTVSEWGLVVLTLLLLTGAKIYFGRRETATAP